MENFKVALVQSDIVWEDINANLQNYTLQLQDIEKVDLIVLPEMFASGFTMNVKEIGQGENDSIFLWMKETAISKGAAIYGSLVYKKDQQYFNRAYFVKDDGSYEFYDKRHLFSLAKEDRNFSRGELREVIEYKGWRIFPQICYDLRFPVWSRNDLDYDLIIYIANWPEKRRYAWQTLLKARAIENMSYVIGVNRVGEDANKFLYQGDSALINPMGKDESNIESGIEKVYISELNKEYLIKVRKSLGFLKDKDSFNLIS